LNYAGDITSKVKYVLLFSEIFDFFFTVFSPCIYAKFGVGTLPASIYALYAAALANLLIYFI
jgi:hypothetical protein